MCCALLLLSDTPPCTHTTTTSGSTYMASGSTSTSTPGDSPRPTFQNRGPHCTAKCQCGGQRGFWTHQWRMHYRSIKVLHRQRGLHPPARLAPPLPSQQPGTHQPGAPDPLGSRAHSNANRADRAADPGSWHHRWCTAVRIGPATSTSEWCSAGQPLVLRCLHASQPAVGAQRARSSPDPPRQR